MKTKLKLLPLLIAGLPFMTISGEAQACGACVAAVNSASAAISGAVSGSASSIVAAITQATGQISQELEKQIAASKKTEEAVIAWQTQRDLQQKVTELDQRTYARAPNICNVMNVSRRLSTADQDARGEAAAATEEARKRNMQTENLAKYLADLHTTSTVKFADMNNAHLRADGIFAPKSADGKTGLTYNEKQAEAAEFFSGLVVNPLPKPQLNPSLAKTQQGKAYETLRMAEQARLSMADYSLSEIQSGYKPNPGMGKAICDSWGELHAKSGSGLPPPACTLNPNASINEVMEFMVTNRMSPEWTRQLTTSAPEGVLREQAAMMAFKLWMDYRNYRQMERMEGMMAAGVAIDTDAAMRPLLSAQRNAATAAAARTPASAPAAK
jgi:hypothetical protein